MDKQSIADEIKNNDANKIKIIKTMQGGITNINNINYLNFNKIKKILVGRIFSKTRNRQPVNYFASYLATNYTVINLMIIRKYFISPRLLSA